MGFEDDIRNRIPNAMRQQDEWKAAEQREALETKNRQMAHDTELALANTRINEIGRSAANMLLEARVPTLDVWDDREFGEPESSYHITKAGGFSRMQKKVGTYKGRQRLASHNPHYESAVRARGL